MKRLILSILVLALCALPASAAIVSNGDGTATVTFNNAPFSRIIAACINMTGGTVDNPENGWGGASGPTCGSNELFVNWGVCTAQQATDNDPLPTVTCGASQQANGFCSAAHDGLLIPQPVACGKLFFRQTRAVLKAFSDIGLEVLNQRLLPAGAPTDGGFGDDDQ